NTAAPAPCGLEPGTQRDAELLAVAPVPAAVVPVEPEPGANGHTAADRTDALPGTGQVPADARADLHTRSEPELAAGRKHPARVAHQVDRIQVDVHSKGHAIGRTHR